MEIIESITRETADEKKPASKPAFYETYEEGGKNHYKLTEYGRKLQTAVALGKTSTEEWDPNDMPEERINFLKKANELIINGKELVPFDAHQLAQETIMSMDEDTLFITLLNLQKKLNKYDPSGSFIV